MKVKSEVAQSCPTLCNPVDYSLQGSSIHGMFQAIVLEWVAISFTLDLEKTVATRDVLGDIDEDRLDDYAIIEDGFLDMDEPLREQIEMEFPVRFLCKEDCKGLCQRCGKDLNHGPCGCDKKEVDPRLEPLRALLERMKEEESSDN